MLIVTRLVHLGTKLKRDNLGILYLTYSEHFLSDLTDKHGEACGLPFSGLAQTSAQVEMFCCTFMDTLYNTGSLWLGQ